ncbi:fibronectin type III domain-containing protein [Brevibacterium yomogidense]|uniref:fibronectin type III domain-containing protein n=1 Tax=Brevibacterium yomogidense TaxID=946573 RepID=UPI0018DF9DE9
MRNHSKPAALAARSGLTKPTVSTQRTTLPGLRALTKRLSAGTGAAALVAAVGLVGGAAPAAATSTAATSTAGTTEDATFSWAVNEESGGGAFFGGANWMVAGEVGDVHGERDRGSSVWDEQDEKHYSAKAGNTTITRPDAGGNQVPATWADRNTDAAGKRLTTAAGSSSWNQANISSGSGTVDPSTNSAEIRWDGSFTLVYYGGMTYWTINDPKLVVSNGTGTITGTLSGYGADMNDLSKWVMLDDRPHATIAELTDVDVTDSGITVTPEYAGVEIDVEPDGPSGPQDREKNGWGSFPQDWIDFNVGTGQAAYWYTSGGQVDVKKTAAPVTIDYSTDALEFLEPGSAPGAPVDVAASQDSSNSSTISWARPTASGTGSDTTSAGSVPPAYQVQWATGERSETNAGNDGDWTGRTVSGAVTSTTASGLEPATTHTARVRSMNHDEGESGSAYSLSSDWRYVTFTTAERSTPSPAPTPEPPEDDVENDGGDGDGTGDDAPGAGDGAVFRWSMNREAGSGAYFGGCNFLSAGISGDHGSSQVWADDALYSSSDGATTIRKADASGGWTEASWSTKCEDRNGATLSTNGKDQWSEQQVVITGGEREELPGGGERIAWDGGFTVVFYGGLTYWWAQDPVLEVDADGNGTVTATAGGYGASMYDASQWGALDERTLTLATLRGVDTEAADADGGFTVTPDYLGVEYDGTGGEGDAGDSRVGSEEGNPTQQVPKTADNEAHWGAFPRDFVDFQDETGQFSYWFSSGGQRDPFKPAEPLTVAYSDDYDQGPGDYSGEGAGRSAGPGGHGAGGGTAGGGGDGDPAAASATDPTSGKKPGDGASPADADFDEDRSAFSQMAQDAAGDPRLSTRTCVIAGLTAGAGLAATITSVVYFRRRLGLDPRMFL